MAQPSDDKHVFVSYVREDNEHIDRLVSVLEAAKVPYWRDRNALGPGDMWKTKIRDAIKSDSLAFLACFSRQSAAKSKSYQNEELVLAIEEFRMRPPGQKWLIPVRLDDSPIPDRDLGAGLTLADINYIDLFGDTYTASAIQLVEAVKAVMGTPTVDPAAIRTAVHEAAAADRPQLLRQLTKQMILDPARKIELDELIAGEVGAILAAIGDENRFPRHIPHGTTPEQRTLYVAHAATAYWELVEPFCWSLQVAARWGTPDALDPWITAIAAFARTARKYESGSGELLDLRELPILVSATVAAIASTAQKRWDNFNALLVQNTFTDPRQPQRRPAVIEMASPYSPFNEDTKPSQILARASRSGEDLQTALTGYQKTYGGYHCPVSEWLFDLLRPVFAEQFPEFDAYQEANDRAEVALGVACEDLGNVHAEDPESQIYFRNKWFGRSTWRSRDQRSDPVAILTAELDAQKDDWAPFKAGMFGRSTERARKALMQYSKTFHEIARSRL